MAQDGFAVLDVSDAGPGIAPDERERVFDSFYSGKAPVDGKVKGSGLGLAIAREYALAQSGRIEVLDRADGKRGVRFRLWLPLAVGAGTPRGGRRGRAVAAGRRRAQVTPALRGIALAAFCAVLGACATPAPPVIITPEEEYEPERVQVPTPLVEYPPIEPVEPPIAASPAADPPVAAPTAAAPAPGTFTIATAPPSVVAVPPAAVREPPVEDAELDRAARRPAALRRARSGRREARARERDARCSAGSGPTRTACASRCCSRSSRATPQDDQRALQLLDNVSKSNPGSPAVKQLAFVLQAQISGRQRAVREEQQKADAALQKLEALRQMERSLLRERARSGGGGGGWFGRRRQRRRRRRWRRRWRRMTLNVRGNS